MARVEGAGYASVDLFRGMRDMVIAADFERMGGTELACMSTTTNLAVALRYSASKSSLVLKLRTESFMDRGASINFLSAFPEEAEVLYPPLSYLRPTGRKEILSFDAASAGEVGIGTDTSADARGATCTVVEVAVAFPS